MKRQGGYKHVSHRWTEEEKDFIIANPRNMTMPRLTVAFNAKFGRNLTVSAISHQRQRLLHTPKTRNKHVYWSQEEEDYLREIGPHYKAYEITNMINEKFGTNRTQSSVEHKKDRLGVKSIDDFKFKKGVHNCESGEFKKGKDHNQWTPKYTMRKRCYGDTGVKCWWIKFKDDDLKGVDSKENWMPMHHWVWLLANGEVPKDHVITFIDGDHFNYHISNLRLVSRGDIAALNTYKLYGKGEEAYNLMKLRRKICEVKLQKKGKRK